MKINILQTSAIYFCVEHGRIKIYGKNGIKIEITFIIGQMTGYWLVLHYFYIDYAFNFLRVRIFKP